MTPSHKNVHWRSLDPAERDAVDRAWLEESRRRRQAYRAGQLKRVHGKQALADIEAALRK